MSFPASKFEFEDHYGEQPSIEFLQAVAFWKDQIDNRLQRAFDHGVSTGVFTFHFNLMNGEPKPYLNGEVYEALEKAYQAQGWSYMEIDHSSTYNSFDDPDKDVYVLQLSLTRT